MTKLDYEKARQNYGSGYSNRRLKPLAKKKKPRPKDVTPPNPLGSRLQQQRVREHLLAAQGTTAAPTGTT